MVWWSRSSQRCPAAVDNLMRSHRMISPTDAESRGGEGGRPPQTVYHYLSALHRCQQIIPIFSGLLSASRASLEIEQTSQRERAPRSRVLLEGPTPTRIEESSRKSPEGGRNPHNLLLFRKLKVVTEASYILPPTHPTPRNRSQSENKTTPYEKERRSKARQRGRGRDDDLTT